MAAILDDLRAVGAVDALRRRYAERDGEWAHAVADQRGLGERYRPDVRRIEDAAYGLRWLAVPQGSRFDLRRSLVPQPPLALLDGQTGDTIPDQRPRPPKDAQDEPVLSERNDRIPSSDASRRLPRVPGWRQRAERLHGQLARDPPRMLSARLARRPRCGILNDALAAAS
jgi:hypothetical protein